jgi:Zn-dependent protease
MEPSFEVLPPKHPVPPPKAKGILGWLAAMGLLAAKFGGFILIFLKTGLTMLLSIGAYSLLFGWKFAAGIVILIFVHEMGHFIAAKCYGIPVTAPVFIPFVGAYVLLQNQPRDAFTNAIVAYAGPLAGTLGGWVCYSIAANLDSRWLMAVASYTFILNAFNLLPVPPLDGSKIWIAFMRRFTPDMKLADRLYVALFLASLIAAMLLGFWEAHQELGPTPR